jgi:hypothetical protein
MSNRFSLHLLKDMKVFPVSHMNITFPTDELKSPSEAVRCAATQKPQNILWKLQLLKSPLPVPTVEQIA